MDGKGEASRKDRVNVYSKTGLLVVGAREGVLYACAKLYEHEYE